jgi:hypothetical protein
VLAIVGAALVLAVVELWVATEGRGCGGGVDDDLRWVFPPLLRSH